MADANEILKLLVQCKSAMTLDGICRAMSGNNEPVGSPERKQITKCLGRLISRKLVQTIKLEADAFPPRPNRGLGYVVTKEGKKFVAQGHTVQEHVLGYPIATIHKRGPKANAEVLRANLWRAFRHLKKASLRELIEVSDDHGVVKVETVAAAFMKALIAAGIAVELKTREKGFAPTSNGFKRYALIKDLGVQPPKAARDFLLDTNTGEQLPFAASKKSEAA